MRKHKPCCQSCPRRRKETFQLSEGEKENEVLLGAQESIEDSVYQMREKIFFSQPGRKCSLLSKGKPQLSVQSVHGMWDDWQTSILYCSRYHTELLNCT